MLDLSSNKLFQRDIQLKMVYKSENKKLKMSSLLQHEHHKIFNKEKII
jgi:hypothetical protein